MDWELPNLTLTYCAMLLLLLLLLLLQVYWYEWRQWRYQSVGRAS